MKVPFGTISITPESKRLISSALKTGRVSCGRYVFEFEKKFARLIGTSQAVALSSGADADALALAVLYDFGARRGDEIIIPALSFAATGNAVLQAGFVPVFVDIERKTLNIDPSKIEAAISKKTRAIMPVHLMGKPAKMDEINAIAKARKLFVIEDAAEAYGTVYKGKHAGTLADMGAFSLYVAHMISSVEGGMVVTDREDFAGILRSLRSHGRACKCESCVLNLNSGYCDKRFSHAQKQDIRFIFERIGFSCKMNELEAAVGIGSIGAYPDILKKRRKNLLYMMSKFKEFSPLLYTLEEEAHEEIGPHAFAIILGEEAGFSRESLVNFMEEDGVDTRNLFLSMPSQCAGFKYLDYKSGDFPEAEYIGNNGMHIGIHQDLAQKELDYILVVIRKFLKTR